MLGLPNWPATRRDIDFVRSFGTVRKRELGGLSSWVGEHQVCEAARALRFPGLPTFLDPKSKLRVPFQLAFRRFFYDGRAVGKFEVGLATEPADTNNVSQQQTEALLDHFLNIPVDIPEPFPSTGKTSSRALSGASKRLCKLYLFSTTKFLLAKNSTWWSTNKPDWWVSAAAPILFLVHQASETIEIPGDVKQLSLDKRFGLNLSYTEITRQGKSIPVWVLGLGSGINYKLARSLRINLLRLHAEHECLKLILQNIRLKRISIVPRVDDPTHPSDLLQKYLSHATDKVLSLESEVKDISDEKLAMIASQSVNTIDPGERELLLQAISDIRPTVARKVEAYVDRIINNYTINNSNIGAVGDNATNYLHNQNIPGR